jgi:carbon-monoxide dehydrogenase medium subunit
MRATGFEFCAPDSLEGVFEVLDKYEEEAKLLAGGMSMMPAMNLGLLRPAAVVSLNHLAGLDGIREDDGAIRIGAMARHAEVASSELLGNLVPLLSSAASVIGDVQIRNRGTIGGSIAHADPAGDYLAPAIVLDAQVTLASSNGTRTLAADEFFVDIMRTSAAPTEILVEVSVPKPPEGARMGYARLVRVEGNFAIVTAAAVVAGDSAKVALGGVTARPVLIEQPAQPLRAGDEAAFDLLGETAFSACEDAFGDLTGTSDYRREMTKVYAKRSVQAALDSDETEAVRR